jgi:small subunit ribosomal protein S14
MAKKSMKMRELKRAKLVKRYAKKRAALKEIIRDLTNSDEERAIAVRSRDGLTAYTASSGLAGTSCGKPQ